jgi:hypothetical protein
MVELGTYINILKEPQSNAKFSMMKILIFNILFLKSN